MEDKCCPTSAGKAHGSSPAAHLGAFEKLASGMELYVTGAKDASKVILVAPDIFGIHVPASLTFLDKLALESGAKIVAIDHFHGKPWALANFPPADYADLMQWIGSISGPEKLKSELHEALSNEASDASIGYLGFCWGGKVALSLVVNEPRFKAVASAHPSMLTKEMVASAAAKIPVCLLPSKDEDAVLYEEIRILLDSENKKGQPKHIYKRYDNVQHGWCQARSSPGQPAFERDVADACKVLAEFFKSNL
jgi:dienelactone hydrolase